MIPTDYNRRGFLKVSVAGSATLLGAQSPNDAVRVAVIGAGNRGSYLLQNLLKVPGVRVVAVCDIDPQRLQKAVAAVAAAGQPSPEGYAEYRKLLDRKDVDAVVIASPVDLHKEMAISSL